VGTINAEFKQIAHVREGVGLTGFEPATHGLGNKLCFSSALNAQWLPAETMLRVFTETVTSNQKGRRNGPRYRA
jgi:hypothetical protein